ncbi:MAG: DsbA family protein [Canibacter sp.]
MVSNKRRSYDVDLGIPLTIFVIVTLIIGISFVLQRGWEAPPEPNDAESQAEFWDSVRNSGRDPLVFGESNAPVELVVFSDYQCAFCAHWSRETLPELTDYVEDGQLRIIWRDANLSGRASEHGARASYAAALQDRFFEYHQTLVSHGRGASDEDLTDAALTELADGLGLNVQRFTADMNSPEAKLTIRQHEAEAQKYGVTRAPSFLFNGDFISGVQSTKTFITQLDAALEEQFD